MTRSPVGGAAERPFAHLAEYLIALRRAARLPQRALARAANVSRGTVQRAESGTAPPSLAVLDAYVRACSGSPADHARARLLRTRGRTAQRDRLRHLDAPAPPLIPTEDELGAALAAAYERAGAPSLSDARLTPGRSPLPHTTAWRIVKRRKLPPTAEQLVTFLTACGISPAEQRPYIDAYHRITADRGTRPLPPSRRRAGRLQRIPLSHGGTDGPPAFTDKISPPFQNLLTVLSPEDVEAVLTAGTARLFEERGRLNGTATAVPEWLATTALVGHGIDPARDSGVDLVTRTADGHTTIYQVKHHQRRPGPPPKQTSASTTPPPGPALIGEPKLKSCH
ncbi:helix-turn-helix transcriptional regulator [Streptomyces mirabilis]|uniref:helix-turn-helix domain-containing protein n=1 Tax=Streptomyces mirabilis TaxID=68239 RepID=UPI0033D03539